MSHDFCRTLLAEVRAEAKREHIELPKNITALRADRRQFFVETDSESKEYVSACCAFEAKAKFISSLIDKTKESR